jgi:hypothetical protein
MQGTEAVGTVTITAVVTRADGTVEEHVLDVQDAYVADKESWSK